MLKLTKLESKHNNLRTDEVVGTSLGMPEVGHSFTFIGEALDETIRSAGGCRTITTSNVTEVMNKGDVVEFKTLNSTYRLERIDAEDLLN